MGSGGVAQSAFVPMPPEGIKLILALYRAPSLENLKRLLECHGIRSERIER